MSLQVTYAPLSALRAAYESARRQLQDLEHYRRGDPLSRSSMLSGI